MNSRSDEERTAFPDGSSQDYRPVHAQASSLDDGATKNDSLGFDLYVQALADFLLAPNTRAPLTVSIEGPWGSGKSSFMLQLKQRLTAESSQSICIDFNAWKYEKQEELWAAFALTVTRSLRRQVPFVLRVRGDISQYFSCLSEPRKVLKLLAKLTLWIGLVAICAAGGFWLAHESVEERRTAVSFLLGDKVSSVPEQSASLARSSKLHNLILERIGQSLWGAGALLLIGILWKMPEGLRKALLETGLETYIDRPDYKGKAAFVDTFAKDFSRTIKAYAPKNGKVFVFIDDIDRCEPPKAADLMQAMNLMIGDGGSLFFILGLDRTKVASAVAFKFREMVDFIAPRQGAAEIGGWESASVGRARGFGDEFLEKFIQLSFRVPMAVNTEQALRFITALTNGGIAETAPKTRETKAKSLILLAGRVVSDKFRWLTSVGRNLSKSRTVPVSQNLSADSQSNPNTPAEPTSKSSVTTHDPFRIEKGPESERIHRILLAVLKVFDYNPRRIKIFVNVFRLSLYVASRQGLLDIDCDSQKPEVTPEQLGAFIALTTRYPEILTLALNDSDFLSDLVAFSVLKRAGGDRTKSSVKDEAILELWCSRPGVEDLLSETFFASAIFRRLGL